MQIAEMSRLFTQLQTNKGYHSADMSGEKNTNTY